MSSSNIEPATRPRSMSIATLIKYLFGSRQAIVRILETPGAIWLGGFLVFSAAFAREYDAHDLLREPWHLVIPLGASIMTSFLLFALVSTFARWRSEHPKPFWSGYRSFLAVYWMTAPLAWLYAIPVERFLTAPAATSANLAILFLVSLWRVVLMTRVIDVVFGTGKTVSFLVVMFFADTVMLAILWMTPLPVVNLMGGIPMTESEELIRDTATLLAVVGALSWLVWLLVGLLCISYSGRWQPDQAAHSADGHVHWSLWMIAICAIIGWSAVLPFTQSEQRLRYDMESALRNGRIGEGLEIMSKYTRTDFPPLWTPPPHLAYPNPQPSLTDVLDVIANEGAANWVIDIYLEKLGLTLESHWSEIDSREIDVLERLMERTPRAASFVADHQRRLATSWEHETDTKKKERIVILLKAAGLDIGDALRHKR